mmetsp:Transcript_37538/g.86669  ORF Transcript_37538/g.86669 Transcript_37538/m.86669 type:complete len:757 (+) Transcript_37538:81-2351(+)
MLDTPSPPPRLSTPPTKTTRASPPRLSVAGSLRELPVEQTWVTLKDGSMYKGSWLEGYPHGYGERWSANVKYNGQWAHGKQDGFGRQIWNDGRVYKGDFKQGMLDGHGRLEWSSVSGKTLYEGEFAKNLRHGHGRYVWDDGRVYDGAWSQGKRHGEALCTDRHGNERRGLWADDRLLRWCEEDTATATSSTDAGISGGRVRRSFVYGTSYVALFGGYWLGSRKFDPDAGDWDFDPEDMHLLLRGGFKSLQPNFVLPGPRYGPRRDSQTEGSSGSGSMGTTFSLSTPSLQAMMPLWPMTPQLANFKQPSLRASTPSKQPSPNQPPASSLGSTTGGGLLPSTPPSSTKASPGLTTSVATAMPGAGVGDDIHDPPATLLGAATKASPDIATAQDVILFGDEDDLVAQPTHHINGHSNGHHPKHLNGEHHEKMERPAPIDQVNGLDSHSLTGTHPAKPQLRYQRRPLFIVAQTLFVFLLWLIFAMKEAAEGKPLNLAVAGLDSLAPESFDLRLTLDCEDMRWQLWRWWTYQFTHVGVQHILSKCSLNVLYGVPLEGVLGPFHMALLYNIGIFGGACFSLVNDAHAPVVGMSAGCYSMLGIHLTDIAFNWSSRYFRKTALCFLTCATSFDLLLVYTTSADVTHTLEGANIGGFITGILMGIVVTLAAPTDTWERTLRNSSIALGVVLALACFLWSMSKWPPQDLWEGDGWCWQRQVLEPTLFGDRWQCLRCSGDACIARWSQEAHVREVGLHDCSSDFVSG